MTSIPKDTTTAKKPRRIAREPKPVGSDGVGDTPIDDAKSNLPAVSLEQAVQPASAPKPEKPTSKASVVLEMLQKSGGATLDQMVAATGWLPHTTRAVLTGFKKKGHVITSDKVDGVRTYRIAPAAAAAAPAPASSRVTAVA